MPDQGELAREVEVALRERRGSGMANFEVADQAGARVLIVRFTRATRAKLAIAMGVLAVPVLGGPWLIPLNNEAGLPDTSTRLPILLVSVLAFGPILVLPLITAVRGGFLALAQGWRAHPDRPELGPDPLECDQQRG